MWVWRQLSERFWREWPSPKLQTIGPKCINGCLALRNFWSRSSWSISVCSLTWKYSATQRWFYLPFLLLPSLSSRSWLVVDWERGEWVGDEWDRSAWGWYREAKLESSWRKLVSG